MSRMIYDYTKTELETASTNPIVFKKKLKKAFSDLLPYEIDQLQNWLWYFTVNKPELKNCALEVLQNSNNQYC